MNVALRVLNRLDLKIPVCGMVKDDNHRTRGLYFHNVEIPIDTNSEGVPFDHTDPGRSALVCDRVSPVSEARSRFTRSWTTSRHRPDRRKSLMRMFQSLEAIREAEVDELRKAPSMNEQSAQRVYEFFHRKCKENGNNPLNVPANYDRLK